MGTRRTGEPRGIVVAVDGGGSKTDAAVVDAASGDVLGRCRGGPCSHHEIGPDRAVRVVDAIVTAALAAAGRTADEVEHAGCYLTAIDLPDEQARMTGLLGATAWGSRSLTVDNDLFALLRSGTDEPDAAVVVCGTGINGAAVRADGATARIPALGKVSGDWGGGADLVEEALWLAARAEDGRGPSTGLREAVLRWTGASSVQEVSVAVHRRELDPADWRHRVPEILTLAAYGDHVARDLVRRQGHEIGVLACSLLARLGLEGAPVPIVLGGGIAASHDAILLESVRSVLSARAPAATLTLPAHPPIDGAILLARQRHQPDASSRVVR